MPTINVRWADNTAQLRTNLKEGVNQIEATRASVDRLVKALAGDNLVAAAHKWTAAIAEMGGVSKIASADAVRALGTVTKAIETLERQGKAVPAQLREMAKELQAAVPSASALSNWMGTLGTTLVGTAAGFVSAQAVIGGVSTAWHTLTGFVADSVKSYAAAEAAQVKLTAALRAQGMSTPAVIAQYKALSDQFQQTTVFSDDLITEMTALLVQVGNVMPSQMNKALDAATNLAAGLGIDLETATTLVAKAAAGHTETLGKYGITVDQAALKTRGLDAVMEAINRQFGGQAAAQIETYAGKVKQLENAWDNVKESVGKAIANDPIVIAGLRNITDAAKQAEDGVGGVAKSYGLLSGILERSGLSGYAKAVKLFEDWARSANEAADATDRLNRLQQAVKPVASHETETDRQEAAALKLVAARKLQAERDAAAQKAAEAYAKALEAINQKIRDGERPISDLNEAQQKLILHYRELKLSNDEIAMKMRLSTTTIEDFTKKTDEAATAVRNLKESALSGPIPGLRLYDATKDVEELQKFIDKLKAIEEGSFRPKTDPSILTGPIAGLALIKPEIEKAKNGVAELAQAFAQLAQVSGGKFGGFIQDIGQMVTGLNLAQTAVQQLASMSKASFAQMAASAISVVSAIANIGFSLQHVAQQLIGEHRFDVENVQELIRAVNASGLSFEEYAAKVKAAGITQAQFNALIHANNAEEFAKALRAINKQLDEFERHEREINDAMHAGGAQSQTELQHAADIAREAFDRARASGDYTAEQLLKLEVSYQQALAALGGAAGEAAKAWLRAHDIAAGAIAAVSQEMQAAQKELEGLIAQRDSLSQSIAAEAPEEHMGVIEAQQRAQRDALDKEIQARADAYAKLAHDEGQEMADEIVEALKRIHIDPIHIQVVLDTDGISTNGRAPTYVNGEAPEAKTGGIVHQGWIEPPHFDKGGFVMDAPQTGGDTQLVWTKPGELIQTVGQQANVANALVAGRTDPQVPALLRALLRAVESDRVTVVDYNGEAAMKARHRVLDRNGEFYTAERELLGIA